MTNQNTEFPEEIYFRPDGTFWLQKPDDSAIVYTRTARAIEGEKAEALTIMEQEELTYTASIYGGDPDGCSDYDSEITIDLKSLLGERVYKTIIKSLTPESEGIGGKGDIDADGLHSKIDMDIEDQLGRDVTLEESKIIGLAIRGVLSTLTRPQEIDVEQLKASVKKNLLPEVFPKGAPIHEDKAEWDFCSGLVSGIGLTINHLAASNYLSAPDGREKELMACIRDFADCGNSSSIDEVKEQYHDIIAQAQAQKGGE